MCPWILVAVLEYAMPSVFLESPFSRVIIFSLIKKSHPMTLVSMEQNEQPLNINVFVSSSSRQLDYFKSNYGGHQSNR